MAKTHKQLFTQAEAMAGMSKDEIAEQLKGKGFSAKEVEKISEMADKIFNGESVDEEPEAEKEAPKGGSKAKSEDKPEVPRWDLWQLRKLPNGDLEKLYVINHHVTLPQHLVDMENDKSHNTLRRYFPAAPKAK